MQGWEVGPGWLGCWDGSVGVWYHRQLISVGLMHEDYTQLVVVQNHEVEGEGGVEVGVEVDVAVGETSAYT